MVLGMAIEQERKTFLSFGFSWWWPASFVFQHFWALPVYAIGAERSPKPIF